MLAEQIDFHTIIIGVLVIQNAQEVLFLQHAADGQKSVLASIIGHLLAHHLTKLVDGLVHVGIVLLASNGQHGITMERHRGTQKLPVAKMTRAHNHALALGIGLFQILQALYLDVLADVVLVEQWEAQNLHRHAPKPAQAVLSNLLSSLRSHAQALLHIGLSHLQAPILHHQHRHTAHKAGKELAQAQGQ